MKKIFSQQILFIIILSLAFSACKIIDIDLPSGTQIWKINDNPHDPYKLGNTKLFWAQNLTNYSYYRLTAMLLAQNTFCNVWVEMEDDNLTPTPEQIEQAQAIASEYLTMYERLLCTETGLGVNFTLENGKTYNTMQVADFMGDQDGKLCILLLDIKDGLEHTNTYVAGYFTRVNFYKDPYYTVNRSNESDMIYVTTRYPERIMDKCRITAHEVQHLMNFVTSVRTRTSFMDLWIDEGLSSAAEWIYAGSHSENRIKWYNEDQSGLIKNGNNFFHWNNHRTNPIANMDDYATVYIFFQWLRLQKDGNIYNKIISSQYSNIQAVTNLFDDISWGDLLEEWYIANYYHDDNGEINLNRHYTNNTSASALLFSGEGVFSYSENPPVLDNSGYIRYTNVTNALFTLNTNSIISNLGLHGTITGEEYPLAGIMSVKSMSGESVSVEPRAISAGELLRQNFDDL
jgi:hypothetical protein